MTLRKRRRCWLSTPLPSTYLWPGAGSSYTGKLFWHDSILTYIKIVFGFLHLSLLSTKNIFYGAVYILCEKSNTLTRWSPTCLDQRLVSGFVEDSSFMAQGWGMAWDDSRVLHLLCSSVMLLLHQLNLISPGIRFQRLGTLALTAYIPLYRLFIIKIFPRILWWLKCKIKSIRYFWKTYL